MTTRKHLKRKAYSKTIIVWGLKIACLLKVFEDVCIVDKTDLNRGRAHKAAPRAESQTDQLYKQLYSLCMWTDLDNKFTDETILHIFLLRLWHQQAKIRRTLSLGDIIFFRWPNSENYVELYVPPRWILWGIDCENRSTGYSCLYSVSNFGAALCDRPGSLDQK